ncbi:uncharacterized protein LOC143146924 isoform X1 [Ptiloglossa arizonensis]|uniref:uncharacterized protein LOC143146924 isoform X1 n=1 Tax=Ptiloglossa arizonensis TaxID=3350558 RepID=UPI003F9FDAD7
MTLIIYLLIPTIHLAIDIVMPTNRSQDKDFLFELNYGVDNQEYFYYITIHSYMGTAVVGHLIVSCYTMYVMYTQHAYALFAIVSYQLKTVHVLDSSSLINLKDDYLFKKYEYTEFTPEEQLKVHNKLFICIQEHKNAIKYSDLLESLFMKSIFFQLFFNVLCISTTGVYTVMKIGNVGDMMRYGSFTLAQIIYIFSLCLPGQRLVNHSEQVYIATCEIRWHTFSKKSLSLYKFLLARSLVLSKITALKMAPLTMETFLMTAMSYFTVLLSTNDILE